MAAPKYIGFDTLSLHAGQRPDPVTGSRAVPLHQTVSYVFSDADQAASRFSLARSGHAYSRISNPTVAVLEERVAALEGGVGAVATASGMAAIHLAIATLVNSGDHIVSSRALYGGTHNLFSYTLPRFGVEVTLVDPRDHTALANAIRPNTRLVFAETLANPSTEVLDIERVAAIAHDHKIPLILDATITTPYLLRAFDYGADLVVHSLTKFMGGHGIAIGGVVVDSGKFCWESSGKFPELSAPYAGLHDINFTDSFGPSAFLLRARREGLRDFGACMSPTNAFYILQGVETLPMRMQRHTQNAQAIAEFLQQHRAVESVSYPGLPDHPDYNLSQVLLPRGCGAVLSFEIQGGHRAGMKLIESLRLFSHLANVGDAKSLVIHPASTTHGRMDKAALRSAGISEGMVRLSVGLEDVQDLIDDLARGLHLAQRG